MTTPDPLQGRTVEQGDNDASDRAEMSAIRHFIGVEEARQQLDMPPVHSRAIERDPAYCPCHTTYGKLLRLSRRLPRHVALVGYKDEGYPLIEVLCVLEYERPVRPYLDLLSCIIGDALGINLIDVAIRHGSESQIRRLAHEPGWVTFGDFND